MADLIDRADLIKAFERRTSLRWDQLIILYPMFAIVDSFPSSQSEPLTDREQRIFLAAMGREEKVCKDVDEKWPTEPYEDSLVKTCREIERKVKKALWTK